MQHLFQFTRVAQLDDPLIQPHEIRLADDRSVKVHVAEKPLFELHRLVKLVKQHRVGVFQLGMPRVDVEQSAQDTFRGRVGEHVIDLVAAFFQCLAAAPHVGHRTVHAEERLALALVHLSAPQRKNILTGWPLPVLR